MGHWGGGGGSSYSFYSFCSIHWGIGEGYVCNIYNGGKVQARTKRTTYRCETDEMDALTQTRVRVSSHTSEKKKIFLLLFTVTALLCGTLL